MDRLTGRADWIAEYLEWSGAGEIAATPGARAGGQSESAGDGTFAAAYLDWMDAAVEDVTEAARREAALWAALRTESECVRILRRMLEARVTTPGALNFAYEALEQADRLLDDERSAWLALEALRASESVQRPLARRRHVGNEWYGLDDWPHAIEHVAADVHALMGKVLELRTH
jgi:hypothetical protein